MVPQHESALPTSHPLCVDLDGTLVKSDTLLDSLLVLLRTHPALLLALPGRLLHGKATLKAFLTESVALDVAHLPYNYKLLRFLRQQHRQGRHIYLVTGANQALACRVADHLGIFTDVLGSDNATNLTGNKKLASLRSRLGSEDFDYIGNATPDLPLLACAKEPMVANPTLALRIRLRARGIQPVSEFQDRSGFFKSAVREMRPHQWAKNLLDLSAAVCCPTLSPSHRLMTALLAFSSFSSALPQRTSSTTCSTSRPIAVIRKNVFAHSPPATSLPLLAPAWPLAFSCWPSVRRACFLSASMAWLLLYLATTLSLLRLSQADPACRCSDPLRALYTAPAGRKRRNRDAHLPLAGGLLRVPILFSRHRQAIRRVGES